MKWAMPLVALVVLVSLSFIIMPAKAEVINSQDFSGLAFGDLNGQDSWAGSVAWDVTTDMASHGKHTSCAQTGSNLIIDRPLGQVLKAGNMTGFARTNTTGGSKIEGWITFLNGTNILGNIIILTEGGGSVRECETAFGSGTVALNTSAAGMLNNFWNNFTIKFTNKTGFVACCGKTCKSGTNYNNNVGLPDGIRLWSKAATSPAGRAAFDDIVVKNNISANIGISIVYPLNITYHTKNLNITVKNNTRITKWFYKLGTNESHRFYPNTSMAGFGIKRGFNQLFINGTQVGGANLTAEVSFTVDFVEVEEDKYASSVYETDHPRMWLNLKVWNWTDVKNISMVFRFNKTIGNITELIGQNYTTMVFVPTINTQNNVTAAWNYTVCYQDNTCSKYNVSHKITIKTISFAGCGGGAVAVEVRGLNETGFAPVNFSLSVAVDIGLASKHLNYSLSGNSTYKFCVAPASEKYLLSMDMEYHAPDTDIRHYFIRNINVTGTNRVYVNLYLLEKAFSNQIDFTIRDTNYQEQPGIIVKALRYFPGSGSYKIVGMGLTGANGITSIFLRKDVYYKWIYEQAGVVLKVTEPETLVGNSIIDYIPETEPSVFFKYYNKIAYSCEIDRAAKFVACSYSDTSGNMLEMNLTVEKVLLFNRSQIICRKGTVSPAGTLVCSFVDYENDTIFYSLGGRFHGSGIEIPWFVREFIKPFTLVTFWGTPISSTMGILLALAVTLVLAFLGIFRPEISIIMSVMGIVVSTALGFLAVSWGAVLGLALAAGFLVFKMRS